MQFQREQFLVSLPWNFAKLHFVLSPDVPTRRIYFSVLSCASTPEPQIIQILPFWISVSGLSMSTRCLLTLPSSSAWVKDVFSPNNPIAIENDSSAACQEVVSAFLDARMKVLPRPTVPPTLPSVDNQESQDEYDKPFIDLNDPEILAALGDEPAQTSGMEWKRKEEAVCKVALIVPPISFLTDRS
jgi:hypothetical protein